MDRGNIENNYWNRVSWRSPSNIALIKYWGKKEGQIPINPSLSFTLKSSFTETTVFYKKKLQENSQIDFTFLFEGKLNPEFSGRLKKFLYSLVDEFSFLFEFQFKMESKNSFPHSAGIASSASSFSALALCLCSMEQEISGKTGPIDFFQKASFIARLGSGSACRSLYGGFTTWGQSSYLLNSSDQFAIPIKNQIHPIFQNLHDSILIIDSGPKNISSSLGHLLMGNHPGKKERVIQANTNFIDLLNILKEGDFERFSIIVEQEALNLHALMQTSNPPYNLLKPETLEVIERLKYFREKKSAPVCFTLDAGPNIHLLFPLEIKNIMTKFIEEELIRFCQSENWLDDRIGSGPELIYSNQNEDL